MNTIYYILPGRENVEISLLLYLTVVSPLVPYMIIEQPYVSPGLSFYKVFLQYFKKIITLLPDHNKQALALHPLQF